jgi:hypothetical protein
MIKLSSPSKMKGTAKTWSTVAVKHCPASRDKKGDLVPACAGCYAAKGFYRMPTVNEPREHNAKDWKREEWVSEMVAELSTQMYFRWFDSGDMFHIGLAEKIYQVMKQSPNTRFWLPTRMHKIAKFRPIIAKMEGLPNVVVRKSGDEIDGSTIRGKNTSTIICSDSQADSAWICPATIKGNKPNCKANACTACWDKNIKVIAYNYH